MEDHRKIDDNYEAFYAKRASARVYPTEFVVRTFKASYPALNFEKPQLADRVLDVAFGDGRNTTFLCECGYDVSGVEITQGIVDQTTARLNDLGLHADLRVGRNTIIPFDQSYFDAILACHCCYYCDDGESFADNMTEYARVLKSGGWLVASLADSTSYIFDNAQAMDDGSFRIQKDPYGNRDGYRLQGFADIDQVTKALDPWFEDFSFGTAANDYFGVAERLFWVVCKKRNTT